MGHFSVEIYAPKGSTLGGNQHIRVVDARDSDPSPDQVNFRVRVFFVRS